MVAIPRLKVKPRKLATNTPCAAQLSQMLATWASTGDTSSQASINAARELQDCMKNSGGAKGGKARKSTINYHLARLGNRS